MWHTDILNIGFEKQLKNFDDPGNIFKGKAEYNMHFSDIAWSIMALRYLSIRQKILSFLAYNNFQRIQYSQFFHRR